MSETMQLFNLMELYILSLVTAVLAHWSITGLSARAYVFKLEASVSLTEMLLDHHNKTVKNGNSLAYVVQISYHVPHFNIVKCRTFYTYIVESFT